MQVIISLLFAARIFKWKLDLFDKMILDVDVFNDNVL